MIGQKSGENEARLKHCNPALDCALIDPGFSVNADPFEVAEVFEVPLSFLINPAMHHRHAVDVSGIRREFFSMPWEGLGTDGQPRRYFVWGATAAMLRNFYGFLLA